tara:strand:- start:337 stop:1902 length:1566 start_codon:yes stop_codon:yes gene_type:complete
MNRLDPKLHLEKKIQALLAFYTSGNFEEVILKTKPLIKKFPNIIDLYNLLALSYNGYGDPEKGIFVLNEALKVQPKNIHVLNNLGLIYSNINNFKLSNECLRKALDLKPDFFQAINNLGNLLLKINKSEEAIKIFNKVSDKESENYIFHFTLGSAYQQSGNFKNARTHFDKCLELRPHSCSADKAISLMTNYQTEKTHLDQMKKKIESKLPKEDLMLLNFALGKAHEDLKEYKSSFKHLKVANNLKNELSNYRPEKEEKVFNNIKLIFNNLKIDDQVKKETNKKIIFIIGMPRSGTSLVEQILSSHKDIYGAGELPFMGSLSEELFFKNEYELKYKKFDDIDKSDLNKVREKYLDSLSIYNFNEKYVIDKAPLNFKWVGLILKIMPDSKIIHCRRDPMDICWSNYKNFFSSKKLNFSYKFENLAKYYSLYSDIMNFWSEKFKNKIYNLDYEKMVKNSEEEIKKMVKYCDIEWDENCLSFYKNKKSVSTASLAQVRSPIYKSSIKKWEYYSEDLQLLKKLLN